MRVAYIVSSSYSGSTLLSFLLNAHQEIGTISEFHNMDTISRNPDYMCSCGERIRDCPFFLELKKRLNARGLEFEVDDMDMMLRLHQNEIVNRLLTEKIPKFQSTKLESLRDRMVDSIPIYKSIKEKYYTRIEIFMREILSLTGSSVFLDATKNPYRMLFLSKKFDVKAIYLLKNGIGGAYSYIKAARLRNKRLSIVEASTMWFEEQITISRCLNRMKSDQYIMVSYSELCNETENILSNLFDFLGLPMNKWLKDFRDVPHHILGNAMRLSGLSEIEERKDWMEKLSERDKKNYLKVYEQYEKKLERVNPDIIRYVWH